MTGHGQGPQRTADGRLPVQGLALGRGLDVHRRTVGEAVHVSGDVPLPLGKEREVVGGGRVLAGNGTLSVAGTGLRVRGGASGHRRGRA